MTYGTYTSYPKAIGSSADDPEGSNLMNIVMMTNTYTPHVSGVARSVNEFAEEYRKRGHRVLVVAPEFEGRDEDEHDVVRVPAIQNFNGSDLSVRLPVPAGVTPIIRDLQPDIVHSHHPFLMGDTALRVAGAQQVPIVFTHHTMYERQTHLVPGDSPAFREFIVYLATGYANLCDHVIAPSESVAGILRERGVTTPIAVVPTGVRVARFAKGDGAGFRQRHDISGDAFVVGYVGRLAPEKNLGFLSKALVEQMKADGRVHALIVGAGQSAEVVRALFTQADLARRLHMPGALDGCELVDAYHAMDVFAFASTSETQGMVLAEAMAAATPVVAVDAPGLREIVEDGVNGRLLADEDLGAFAAALDELAAMPQSQRTKLERAAKRTARQYDLSVTARKALDLYETIIRRQPAARDPEGSLWTQAVGFLKAEWDILVNLAQSAGEALRTPDDSNQDVEDD